GQLAGAPSVVADQSTARIRSPASPPPVRKSGGASAARASLAVTVSDSIWASSLEGRAGHPRPALLLNVPTICCVGLVMNPPLVAGRGSNEGAESLGRRAICASSRTV